MVAAMAEGTNIGSNLRRPAVDRFDESPNVAPPRGLHILRLSDGGTGYDLLAILMEKNVH